MAVTILSTLAITAGTSLAASMAAPYNPPANISPTPDVMDSGTCTGSPGAYTCANPCVTPQLTWPAFTNGVSCTNYVLKAINAAMAQEGAGPMVLPSNWYSLTVPEQLFVVADLERVLRGYPPYLGLNAALTAEAQNAAAKNADPGLASGFDVGIDAAGDYGSGGSWSQGFNVLVADYFLMYDDGWGGSAANTANIDCTSATALACWAHRDELLGSDPAFNPGVGLFCTTCEMGTGYAMLSQASYVDLIELPAGAPPAMTFTWASESAYLPGASASTTTTTAPSSTTTSSTIATTTTSTTTPSTTTTTTTTTVHGPGGPTNASITRHAINLSTVNVRWLSQGTKRVAQVILVTYRGTSCRDRVRTWSERYVASRNVTSGTIVGTKSRAYSPAGPYSASLIVRSQGGGSYSGRCYPLGRS